MPNNMPLCFTFAYDTCLVVLNNISQKLNNTQTSIALLTAILNTDKT